MGIAVTADGQRIYVSNGRGKTISAIDPATDSILATVEVGTRPWGIALTADGRKLYTANGPGNDVTVVDTETMTVLKRIPSGGLPWGVAVGPKP
jgi:YVTN family beta-propeller protein